MKRGCLNSVKKYLKSKLKELNNKQIDQILNVLENLTEKQENKIAYAVKIGLNYIKIFMPKNES